MELMKILINDESGQGSVEYALIIGLISLVAIVAASALTGGLDAMWKGIGDKLNDSAPDVTP